MRPIAGETWRAGLIACIGVLPALAIVPMPAQAAAEPGLRYPRSAAVASDQILVQYRGEPGEQVVELGPGVEPGSALRELRADPEVRWAAPDPIARAGGLPRDPGKNGNQAGGWVADQWNFLTPPPLGVPCDATQPCGVDAIGAWRLLERAGHPGGARASGKRGPIVAVIDSGVAYRDAGSRYRKNPDLAAGAFVRGRDFIGNDARPLDRNGHGTHIAATIVEQTDNEIGVTGLGDQLRVMPIRVLDAFGAGVASDVAKGIRFATRNGAAVINLSLEFAPRFRDCARLRGVCQAIRQARSSGTVVVAATGNAASNRAQMPAAVAFGVASSTIRGCLAQLSSRGPGTDITAPGGGLDSDAGPHCLPRAPGPSITQLTLSSRSLLAGRYDRFGYPRYEGTSMAAAHVSAAVALVKASRVLSDRLGHNPGPAAIENWLRCTARAVPASPEADLYGAGLLDLRAAVDPRSCPEIARVRAD